MEPSPIHNWETEAQGRDAQEREVAVYFQLQIKRQKGQASTLRGGETRVKGDYIGLEWRLWEILPTSEGLLPD